ncbi:MAG: hypothetical protein KatS3mg023_3856 [Armatimonadota bacterium]|nr:MAG: hypothetical protein KatS3mg023_3856 [Armatimonadota bacterium]
MNNKYLYPAPPQIDLGETVFMYPGAYGNDPVHRPSPDVAIYYRNGGKLVHLVVDGDPVAIADFRDDATRTLRIVAPIKMRVVGFDVVIFDPS